jgi:hypothetical protein
VPETSSHSNGQPKIEVIDLELDDSFGEEIATHVNFTGFLFKHQFYSQLIMEKEFRSSK